MALRASDGEVGAQAWPTLLVWELLLAAMDLSFAHPIHSFHYFLADVVLVGFFWILAGNDEIPVLFLISLVILAIPYLIFLRHQEVKRIRKR